MNDINRLLEKPCYIIDFLPRQVPKDCNGQFFKVENYLLNNMEKRKLFICRYIFNKGFRRTSGIKFKKVCGKNEAVIMAISKPPYQMYHTLIDKNSFSFGNIPLGI